MPSHIVHRRRAALLGVILVLGCAESAAPKGEVELAPRAVPEVTAPLVVRVDTLLRNLQVPWGVVERTNGGIVVAERTGRLLYRPPGSDTAEVLANLAVYAEEEGIGPETGLMGLAIDADDSTGLRLFAVTTTWRSDGDRDRALPTRLWRRITSVATPMAALKHKNQLLRVTTASSRPPRVEIVVDDLLTAYYHAGGGVSVGPDGRVYLSVGDAILPPLAPDRSRLVGKILRYERDGRTPRDNPFPDSPVFATGLRNTQGLAWLPDGSLLGADHGPSGMEQESGRQGSDELNVISAGRDYGWPGTIGWERRPGVEAPLWVWEQAIAPAGLAVLRSSVAGDSVQVVVAGLAGRLDILTLAKQVGGWQAVGRTSIASGQFGRIRSVVRARDGSLLVTTSNRDARGVPRPGDDLLLRLTLTP